MDCVPLFPSTTSKLHPSQYPAPPLKSESGVIEIFQAHLRYTDQVDQLEDLESFSSHCEEKLESLYQDFLHGSRVGALRFQSSRNLD